MAGVPQIINRGSGQVSAAAALPEASPNAFGAGIGDALERAGGEIQASSMRALTIEKENERQSENAQAAVGAAQLRTQLDQARLDARDQAPEDGAGHAQNVSNIADNLTGSFLGTIKDPRVRQQWTAQTAEMKAGVIDDEEVWARAQRITSIGTNAAEAQRLWGNTLQNTPTPDAFAGALKAGDTFWAGANAPEEVRKKGVREWYDGAAVNYATGLIQSDPGKAHTLLTSGGLDTWITPEKKEALISRADTQLRIQAADQNRQVSVLKAAAVTDAEGLIQQIGQGVVVPDDQLTVTAAKLKAFGLDNKAEELQYQQGKLQMSRLTDKWTPAEWAQHVDPLAAKVAQGGASDGEQRQLKILQELRGPKEARFKNDPDGFSSASGIAPPQVDLAAPDPASVQARKSWAKSFAGPAGLVEPPYLNKDQLQQVRDRVAQSPAATFEVAQEIKNTWGMDAAPSIVRQVGGSAKGDLQVMLGLDPAIAQRYQRGREALDKKAVDVNEDVARQVYGTYVRGLPADLQGPVFDAARKVAAGWMLEKGSTKPPANFDHVFKAALQYAAGRSGDVNDFNSPGGLAELNGRYAWLPGDMTSNDFLRRISRAQPQDWVNAAVDQHGNPVKSVPHYIGPDGRPKPYTKGDALNFAKGSLQTLDQGLYHLSDRLGHTVVDEHGRPWTFDVRRLP